MLIAYIQVPFSVSHPFLDKAVPLEILIDVILDTYVDTSWPYSLDS
jgi:hypothetical protein